MQVGTTKDQGLYNKSSAAVHPGALCASHFRCNVHALLRGPFVGYFLIHRAVQALILLAGVLPFPL